jgi:hypothetical protein
MKNSRITAHQPAKDDSGFIIYKDEEIGDILFGCPPDIVKYFNLKKIPIPLNIVIPQRMFRKGKSYFDMEFIIYSILFSQQNKKLITIMCTESQEDRIRTVVQESLFGPFLKDIFRVFLLESFRKFHFNKPKIGLLKGIAEQIGGNGEIFSHFKEIMSQKFESTKLFSKMRSVMCLALGDMSWMNEQTHNHFCTLTTEAYVKAAMLKHEMNFFAICKEEERELQHLPMGRAQD